MDSTSDVDVVIPVYNEAENICETLNSLFGTNQARFDVYIVFDREDDTTIPAVEAISPEWRPRVILLKNEGQGPHSAVCTGFRKSRSPAVIVYPADDDYNPGLIDRLTQDFKSAGSQIVVASRFMKGGVMKGCPWKKAMIVRTGAWLLDHLAGIPTRDPSNGLRLFSRKVLDNIPIESTRGFTYSIELLAKVHRLGWKITEVPANWFERKKGASRFRILKWLPAYGRWFMYIFATSWLGFRGVTLRPDSK